MNNRLSLKYLIIFAMGVFFVLAANVSYGANKKRGRYVMTEAELQAQVMSFADRFTAIMMTALEDFENLSPTPENRGAVLVHTTYPMAAAYTIAADPDPAVSLLDMVVMITLGRMIYEEVGIADLGKKVTPILKGFQVAEKDVWEIARKIITADEEKDLYGLIQAWRQDHPEVLFFSHIRFKDSASLRGESKSATKKARGLFKSIKEATQQAEEIRLLAERAMFLATRMPMLTGIFADTWASRLANNPDIKQTLNDIHTFSAVAARLAGSTDNLSREITAQREATVDQVMKEVSKLREVTINQVMERVSIEREAAINQLIDRFAVERKQTIEDLLAEEERIKAMITELRQTLAVGNELVTSTNTLVAHFGLEEGEASSEPFDIKEYQTTLVEASNVIQRADGLVKTIDQLMLSEGWENSLPRIIETLDRAGREGEEWVEHAFLLGIALILFFFAAMLAYRYAEIKFFGRRRMD